MGESRLHSASPRRRGAEIFAALEAPSWAPWLRFSAARLDLQAELYEPGQLLLCDGRDDPVALFSMTRIDWDGQVAMLPTSDELAADATSFAARCTPDGNTRVLLSASVRSDVRCRGVGADLLEHSREVARRSGTSNLVGPFRPADFGTHKIRDPYRSFADYRALRRDDGARVDRGLRALNREFETTAEEFRRLRRSYNPERWRRVDDSRDFDLRIGEHAPAEQLRDVHAAWECGETGSWYLDDGAGAAAYIESNVWGRIPLD